MLVNHTCGSIAFILQVSISEAMMAQFSAPASWPAKRAFLRLCRGLHNRNYAHPLVMCSSLREKLHFLWHRWKIAATYMGSFCT